MKKLLLVTVAIIFVGFLSGCSSDTDELQKTSQENTAVPGQQEVNVKSPDSGSGQPNMAPNPGSGAAKTIAPLTQ